jgi:hypothetical protein
MRAVARRLALAGTVDAPSVEREFEREEERAVDLAFIGLHSRWHTRNRWTQPKL